MPIFRSLALILLRTFGLVHAAGHKHIDDQTINDIIRSATASWCATPWYDAPMPLPDSTLWRYYLKKTNRNSTIPSGYQVLMLRQWRTYMSHLQRAVAAATVSEKLHAAQSKLIYAFGVFKGDGLYFYREEFGPDWKFFGFDSFMGLPEPSRDEIKRSTWDKGGKFNPHEPRVVQRLESDLGRATMIAGFYNESLTPDLARKKNFRVASIIDVDVDIYMSAYQALDYVFEHRIAQLGTIVAYDDWTDYHCAPLVQDADTATQETSKRTVDTSGVYADIFLAGEAKAHLEIANKYGVIFRCLAGPCAPEKNLNSCDMHRPCGAAFIVAGFADKGDHGFVMTDADLARWRPRNNGCSYNMRKRRTWKPS